MSTLATELARQTGAKLSFYVKIDGIKYALTDNANVSPSGISDALNCLVPPDQELSHGLDLRTMKADSSDMSFRFRDIRDPDDTSLPKKFYFSKLCATGRGTTGARTTARRLDVDDLQIDADGVTDGADKVIYCQSTSGFDAAGEAHMGRTTFSYTGVDVETQTGFAAIGGTDQEIGKFTGVTMGIYPALRSANRGRTYPHPIKLDSLAGDVGNALVIAEQPYSLIGREIGLYVTAYDRQAGEWLAGQLMWPGIISTDIRRSRGEWVLTAKSILSLLETPVCRHRPTAMIRDINLSGDYGRKWTVEERDENGVLDAIGTFTISAGYYGREELKTAIVDALGEPTNWTDKGGTHLDDTGWWWTSDEDGTLTLNAQVTTTMGEGSHFDFRLWADNYPCHAWYALGFSAGNSGLTQFNLSDDVISWGRGGAATAERPAYSHYHPTGRLVNGGKMRVVYESNDPIWPDQNDVDITLAWLRGIAEEPYDATDVDDAVYCAPYNAIADSGAYKELTLLSFYSEDYSHLTAAFGPRGFLGSAEPLEYIPIEQVYVPMVIPSSNRGILKQLTYPLLSSGTEDYNDSTWDKCPWPLAVDFPIELVDVDSITDMDAVLRSAYPDLARRPLYIIDESTPWIELWAREAKLYGFALVWDPRQSKYACRSIASPDFAAATVTLSTETRTSRSEYPPIAQTTGEVINQWKVKGNYRLGDNKALFAPTYNDPESQQGLAAVISLAMDHPGLKVPRGQQVGLAVACGALFTASRHLWRHPHQRESVSMQRRFYGLVGIGDVVHVTSAVRHPDPAGSGKNSVTDLPALALDVAWSPQGRTGRADLLILPGETVPWAASALVDIDATNGGWDVATLQVTLVALQYGASGDSDDGAAFAAGDFVNVVESAPEDPTSRQEWGPFEVESAYETDGAQILSLVTGTTMAGWDSDTEYVVKVADYGDCTVGQQTTELFQASALTHNLDGSDNPKEWG